MASKFNAQKAYDEVFADAMVNHKPTSPSRSQRYNDLVDSLSPDKKAILSSYPAVLNKGSTYDQLIAIHQANSIKSPSASAILDAYQDDAPSAPAVTPSKAVSPNQPSGRSVNQPSYAPMEGVQEYGSDPSLPTPEEALRQLAEWSSNY
jgi:hypothetical protein